MKSNGPRASARQKTAGIKSVDRALQILAFIAERKRDVTIADISKEIGLHPSTAHHLVSTLKLHDFVAQENRRGGYCLGTKSLEIGLAAEISIDLAQKAMPCLRDLVAQLDENANLAVFKNGWVVYVAQAESSRRMRMFTRPGARAPIHCTGVGKALLAHMPEDQLRTVLEGYAFTKFTVNTISGVESFNEELARVRQRGYAIDNEEYEEGVVCIAAPVFSPRRLVVAGLSISIPVGRLRLSEIERIAQILESTATAITTRLYPGSVFNDERA